MVAPAGLARWTWPAAGAAAAAFLAFVAFHGGRPAPGLERFKPAGLLADSAIWDMVSDSGPCSFASRC